MLVIKDNPLNLEVILALLQTEGCRVPSAETAETGLRLAASECPDLILMDLQLPALTGYEATRQFKADPVTATIPILALTVGAMGSEGTKAREAGCDGCLPKPVDADVFRETLRQVLFRSDQGTQGARQEDGG